MELFLSPAANTAVGDMPRDERAQALAKFDLLKGVGLPPEVIRKVGDSSDLYAIRVSRDFRAIATVHSERIFVHGILPKGGDPDWFWSRARQLADKPGAIEIAEEVRRSPGKPELLESFLRAVPDLAGELKARTVTQTPEAFWTMALVLVTLVTWATNSEVIPDFYIQYAPTNIEIDQTIVLPEGAPTDSLEGATDTEDSRFQESDSVGSQEPEVD